MLSSMFSPNNITYLLLHLILVLIGYQLTNSTDVLIKGIGASLIAAGITGWVIFIYIWQTKETKRRLEILSNFGLTAVYDARGAQIKPEYDKRINKAKNNIDILGFGLGALREDYGSDFNIWKQRAKVRILLINPSFPSKDFSYAAQRDHEENNHSNKIDRDVNKFVDEYSHLIDDSFEIKLYNCLPSVNIFRVDGELFWGPYLINTQSRNTPTFVADAKGPLFDTLVEHFNNIWNNHSVSIESLGSGH